MGVRDESRHGVCNWKGRNRRIMNSRRDVRTWKIGFGPSAGDPISHYILDITSSAARHILLSTRSSACHRLTLFPLTVPSFLEPVPEASKPGLASDAQAVGAKS